MKLKTLTVLRSRTVTGLWYITVNRDSPQGCA